MKTFELLVLTPEKTFFEGQVEAVIVDTISGRIEIMANHIPYAAAVLPSRLRIKLQEGDRLAFVSRGLLEFKDNKAFVLVDSAEWPEDIDIERAKAAKERAEKRIAARDADLDIDRARSALMRANMRLKLREVL